MNTVESAFRYFSVTLCLIFLLGFSSQLQAARSDDLEAVTIQLKWKHQFQFAGYYAALEKGFFEEKGLKVTLRESNSDEDHIQAVLEGKAQYGVSDSRLLYRKLEGYPVILVAQIFQHSPLVFLSKKGSGITSPDDLIGKRVMWSADDLSSVALKAMVQDAIGGTQMFTSVQHNYDLAAFISGEVDVISAYLTDVPFLLKKQGIEVNVINPRVYGIEVCGDNLFTTEREIVEFPGRAQRVREATIRGWEYALEHPEEIIELIHEKYAPELALDMLENEARLTGLVILPELFPVGSFNEDCFYDLIPIYQRLGLIQNQKLDDSFFYEADHSISLTEEETAWLQRFNQPIRVRVGNYPPLEMNSPDPDGLWIDIMGYIASILGLDLQFVPTEQPLNESMAELYKRNPLFDLIPRGKVVGVPLPGYVTTSEFGPTPTGLYAVVTNKAIQGIQDMAGKTVSTGGFAMLDELILERYPTTALAKHANLVEALEALALGEVDAVLNSQPVIDAALIRENIKGIQMVSRTPLPEISSVIAGTPDKEILISILDKTIHSMPSSRRLAFRHKWFSTNPKMETTLPQINLTQNEVAWLQNHPVVTLGFSAAFEPMLIDNQDGTFSGTLGDIVTLMEERVPLDIKIINEDMGDIFKMVEAGEIDGILGMGLEKGQDLGFLLSRPHSDYPYTIFSRAENVPSINNWSDLAGRKVAVARGNISALKRLIEAEPTSIPIEVDSVLEGMRALYTNEVYAFTGHSIWNYQIVKYQLSGIKPAFIDIEKGKAFAMGFAINRDWPEFISIVDKVLASIPPETVAAINHRWSFYESGTTQPRMGLNEEEQAKLWTIEEIELAALRNWPPFDMVTNSGIYEGLDADYLNLLSERIGVPVQAKLFDRWEDVMDAARRGETDGILSIATSPEREKEFFFTDPYLVNPIAAITLVDNTSIKSWNDLNGKTLLVVKDFILVDKIKRELEDVHIIPVLNAEGGLKLLAKQDGDAFIGYIGSASYQMNRLLMSNAKIAFKREMAESHLRIGIRKEDPLLASIFNKAIQSISPQEHLAIQRRWLDGNGASVVRGSPILPESKDNKALVSLLRNLAILFLLAALMLIVMWEIKGRPRYLSIRHTLLVVSFIFCFLIIAIAACSTLLLDMYERQDSVGINSRKSRDIANEIRESTEEMSDYACSFAVTGNPKYEELYHIVKEIREGLRPHPKDYNQYYWDMLTAGYVELDEQGETYNIVDKLETLDLPDLAHDLVAESIEALQHVQKLEQTAINAVKGLFEDETGRYDRHSQPDLKMARDLLFGLEYQEAIAEVLEPIEEYMLFLDWDTDRKSNEIREFSQAIILLIGVFTVITIVFAVYTFILLKRRILSPLSILERDAMTIAAGRFDQITPLDLDDEIGTLSNTFQSMASSIRDRTAALEASESRMQFLLSSSPVVIYSRSIRYPFTPTYITPNIESLIGLQPDDFLNDGKFWVNNIHPEDREVTIDGLSRIQKTGTHICEYRFRFKDGQYHWLLEEVKLVANQQGAPSEMIGYWLDISQRKQTEGELRKLSRAIDQGPAIMIITDEKAMIQYVNPAFTRSTGYTFNEAIGRKPSMLQARGMLPKEHYRELWRTISSGAVWHGELCNRTKDGKLFWEAATIAPVFQQSGKITHYVALKVDITDRKTIENAVRKQNERLRILQQIVSGPDQSEEELLQSILRESCELLDMERAYLARVTGNSCFVEYAYPRAGLPEIGISYSPSAICCGLIQENLPPLMVDDLQLSQYRDTECCFKLNHAAYSGGPVKTSRGLYGILGFTRSTPRPAPFEDQDKDFLEVISGLSGSILERMNSKAELISRANELEVLNESMVDREMRVISLKERINELSVKLGMSAPYDAVWKQDSMEADEE